MFSIPRYISVFVFCVMSLANAGRAAVIEVYLLGGQSNADGRAAVTGLPTTPINLQQPQADVAFVFHTEGGKRPLDNTLTTLTPGKSETGGFGPEITFGRDMADYYSGNSNVSVAIIKYGNGGTNLHTQWKAGGDGTTSADGSEYVIFQNTVAAGLAALVAANPTDTVIIKGMIWMQGESDLGQAAAYETNLTNFIADVRATYGADLPFVIGEIGINGGDSNTATIRSAQAAVAANDSFVGFVDVDTFDMQDSLHFSPAGQISLGSGFATQMQGLLVPDTTKPSPDPMTFSAAPSAVDDSTITMTATSATDTSGVEYFFENTAGGGNDSGWQNSSVYTDTGLLANTQYSYRVKARDKSIDQNETDFSVVASVSTEPPGVDSSPPLPDPMSFSTAPSAVNSSSVTMTATTAIDGNGVEYYFENVAGKGNGGTDSGWQDSAVYIDTGLLAGMEFSYRVKARDKSASQNETAWSGVASVSSMSVGGMNAIVSNGDTYIRNGSSQNSNYGSTASMVANLSGTNVRMAIFSFDISSETVGSLTSAKLELEEVTGATLTYQVWGLLDAAETFNESTLTWNTAGFRSGDAIDTSKAYGGTFLGTFNNAANSVNTVFDVTSGPFLDFLNASGDNDVTFVIVDTDSGTTGSGWATKESTGKLKPTLSLTSPVIGYLNWTANYPELDLSDSSADYDLDGLANIIEAWFGTDPGAQSVGLDIVSTSGSTIVISHPQNASPLSDVQGTYQWSPNLIDWYGNGDGPAGGPSASTTSDTVGSTTNVTFSFSEEVSKVFIRVVVSSVSSN